MNEKFQKPFVYRKNYIRYYYTCIQSIKQNRSKLLFVLNSFNNLSKKSRLDIQKNLNKNKLYKGKIDGLYGPKTEAAIEAYAKSLGKEAHLKSEKLAKELLQTLISTSEPPKTEEKLEPEKKEDEIEKKEPKKGLF